MARLLGHLVAGHADEQPDELRRLVQVEVADGRPGEEAGEDRLADVHRIEDAPQGGVAEPEPAADLQPDLGLVTPDELLGRPLVALADAEDEVRVLVPRRRFGHGDVPCEH